MLIILFYSGILPAKRDSRPLPVVITRVPMVSSWPMILLTEKVSVLLKTGWTRLRNTLQTISHVSLSVTNAIWKTQDKCPLMREENWPNITMLDSWRHLPRTAKTLKRLSSWWPEKSNQELPSHNQRELLKVINKFYLIKLNVYRQLSSKNPKGSTSNKENLR